ncbi:fungal-specific transcription factor domain-containing protein [Infundibulicybe gibba]|nr:fungal-specific transcription factor domain-containing protein [Infundibulicybe gibba]
MDPQSDSMLDTKSGPKAPVVRGARACTVCRAAKMKCVGAEDGQKQCQRCKRANVECIFEKHRRGRKPGSKLSEASKMLRRLEKGLNNAKLKSQTTDAAGGSYQSSDTRKAGNQDAHYGNGMRPDSGYTSPGTHFPSNQLPPLNLTTYQNGRYTASSAGSRTMDMDEDEEDADRNDEDVFPAKLIRRENRRNSFFRTILNPEETPADNAHISRSNSYTPPHRVAPIPAGLEDPITAGLINEEEAQVLFDAIFLRLNPFINLFDPALHSVSYVRSKCPFLFTTLIMAGCKFFRALALFKQCQKLANDFAVRAFAEAWKRVEVAQAFACMTYWLDPDDKRTWTYIGYACRMAVELDLNRYVPHPPPHETEFQLLERRNRERTYLVLFVHDRSLSTQTGRHWMLPEDEFIRQSPTWHEQGGSTTRPEDVIVAAFVSLRRIVAETTDIFNPSKGATNHHEVNYELVLHSCNTKLGQWEDSWNREMERAGGEKFHFSFLSLFRLYVKLFLNSFGVQSSMSTSSRINPSLPALTMCCTSALDVLRIVATDFTSMSVLRYGQDSVTVMTAYSAVFLLKLLRSPNSQLSDATAKEIHSLISKTAEAYHDVSALSPASSSAAYHSRFLRGLVTSDIFKTRRGEKDRYENGMSLDPRLPGAPQPRPVRYTEIPNRHPAPSSGHGSTHSSPPQVYPTQVIQTHEQAYHFSTSPHAPAHSAMQAADYSPEPTRHVANSAVVINNTAGNYTGFTPSAPHHASEMDQNYWRHMFQEMGPIGYDPEAHPVAGTSYERHISQPHLENATHRPHHPQQAQQHHHQGQMTYHMHSSSQPNYG